MPLSVGYECITRNNPLRRATAIFGCGQKTNPLSLEPLSAGSICSLSNTGRTTTGRPHEENSFSDRRYSRIRSTFIRAGQTVGQAPPST
jgi:hypothetical protein